MIVSTGYQLVPFRFDAVSPVPVSSFQVQKEKGEVKISPRLM